MTYEKVLNCTVFSASACPIPKSLTTTMNIAHSIPSTVTGVSFSFLTSDDIRRISVKQIVNPVLLDDLNRPNIRGLYDPALGPSDRSDMSVGFFLTKLERPDIFWFSCSTCHLTYFICPGHYGHIELPAPVFHPLFMGNMFNLLRGTCMFCHRFKLSRIVVRTFGPLALKLSKPIF